MALVYVNLSKELPLTKNRRRYRSNGHVQDVQMLELSTNVVGRAPLATAEVDEDLDQCLPSSSSGSNNRGMQQVSSIEFHRAAASELDDD